MGFSDFVNKAKNLADQHDEQVDRGLDVAGDQAKKRLAGHESQVDGLVDKAQQHTGCGPGRPDRGRRPAAGGAGRPAGRRARGDGQRPAAAVSSRP
jgi:MT0933-like antitoxin protein